MSLTPAPWKCYTRALGGGPLGGEESPFAVVCREFPGDVIPHGGEIGMCVAEGVTPENGTLIAAAPDLLAALRAMLAGDLGDQVNMGAEQAHAAIAKAEGRS